MSRGKIAQFKKNVDRITDLMITFSLNPNHTDYDEIINCESLKRNCGEFFSVFTDTCLLCYGSSWDISMDLPGTVEITVFSEYISDLTAQAIKAPTFTIATKIMYIFYASGQLSMIELFYQLMGWETLPRNTKEQLAGLYRDTKSKYQTRTAQLLKNNPDHFSNHMIKIKPNVADFSYFDTIKERAIEERERNRDHARALGQM